MDLGYDIFRKLDDGKKRLQTLISATPGEYFIRDATTGEIIFKAAAVPPA